MPFYYYFDPTMLIVLPALDLAIWAQINVSTTYSKYNKLKTSGGVTGFEAARRILDANGLYNVGIERIRGQLTDHYDPRANVIRLSEAVYFSTSAAAVGVASHEAGHAVQHAVGYAPIKLRTSIIKVTGFGSMMAMPLFLIGLIFATPALMYAGIILYSLVAFFQLVTLPVEFNASKRAMAALSGSGCFSSEELRGAKKVLSAAALTYVAALASSLLSLLRLLVIANGRSRR